VGGNGTLFSKLRVVGSVTFCAAGMGGSVHGGWGKTRQVSCRNGFRAKCEEWR